MDLLSVKFHKSSAFHPQANGRSERTNCTVGQILRSFTAKRQSIWLESLPAVEFAISSAINTTTGFSPFQLLFGHPPRLFSPSTGPSDQSDLPADTPPALSKWLRQRASCWASARDELCVQWVKQAAQHNKRHTPPPEIAVGSFILLNTANWHNSCQAGSDKLKEQFEGPYKVLWTFNNGQSVEVLLPNGDRRHPVFHISKVKSFVEQVTGGVIGSFRK